MVHRTNATVQDKLDALNGELHHGYNWTRGYKELKTVIEARTRRRPETRKLLRLVLVRCKIHHASFRLNATCAHHRLGSRRG